MADTTPVASSSGQEGDPRDSVTRGFLFCDLRGYTNFVESRGAAVAAELLHTFRRLVRDAVATHRGAEIKTEGDSFYIVFSSVGRAVECGVAITAAAEAATREHPDQPIPVGVGIHAGETVETPEGFVGSAVNMAARLCSEAKPGEVLVSDTVRALTANTAPVSFAPAGRRRLKGIRHPVAVYAAQRIGTPFDRPRTSVVNVAPLAALLAGAGAAALVVGWVMVSAIASGSERVAVSPSQRATGIGDAPVAPLDAPLEPGTYHLRNFRPAVVFTVADRWRVTRDDVDAFQLEPSDDSALAEHAWGRVDGGFVQIAFRGPCVDSPTEILPNDPRSVIDWLQQHEHLDASSPFVINLGGHPALALDASLKTGTVTGCERPAAVAEDDWREHGQHRVHLFRFSESDFFVAPQELKTFRIVTAAVDGQTVTVLVRGGPFDIDEFLARGADDVVRSIRFPNSQAP